MGTGSVVPAGQDASASVAHPVPQRPQFFNFDAHAVRVVGDPVAPWFVAADVISCLGLGATRISEALDALEEDEKGYGKIVTLGGEQQVRLVTESGLYALIFKSRKPEARLFRRWVTSEVLPAIRRTGAFAVPSTAIVPVESTAPRPIVLNYPTIAPPRIEAAVGRVLYHCVRIGYSSAIVKPSLIAKRAADRGAFPDLITHTENHQQTARFMLNLRRFFRRWLPVEGLPGLWMSIVPLPGKRRRYYIRQHMQDDFPLIPVEGGGL